jgi:hypothetical protein
MAIAVRSEDFSNLETLVKACLEAKKLPTCQKYISEETCQEEEERSPAPKFFQFPFPHPSYYSGYPLWGPSPVLTSGEFPDSPTTCGASIFPTPPPTPEHSVCDPSSFAPESMICLPAFEAYLEETWPSKNSRRGCSVIRAGLYDQIVSVLHGVDVVNPKIRHWIKSCEFFTIYKEDSIERKVSVAIPVIKGQKHPKRFTGSYKLVARVEDFANIIAQYHNSATGHPGIRKTYGQVSSKNADFLIGIDLHVFNLHG